MILDKIERGPLYASLHRHFAPAFTVLSSMKPEALVPGTFEIDGSDLYYIVVTSRGGEQGVSVLEAHRKYIDLQAAILGEFAIGWRALDECLHPEAGYNEEKDCILFRDAPRCTVPVTAGTFAIFFPGDAHAPAPPRGELIKVVFKIAVST